MQYIIEHADAISKISMSVCALTLSGFIIYMWMIVGSAD